MGLVVSVGCGGDDAQTSDGFGHGHEIDYPVVNAYLAYSAEIETYSHAIVTDFSNCRMSHTVFLPSGDKQHWITSCSEHEMMQGRALATQELLDLYVSESEPLGQKGSEAHCRFAFYLPPVLSGTSVGLANEGDYSDETLAMRDFFVALAENYPAPE